MAVIKNDYPILEYDTESAEILRPEFGMQGLRLPKKCVYAFLGDAIDTYAASLGARTVWSIHTITKDYPVYVTDCQEEEIVLCEAPLGASAAVQNLDSLIACGVEQIVCAGSCGVLANLPENVFLVPVRALRDEGTSFHYLPPSRYAEPDPEIVKTIEEVLSAKHIPYEECMTWTTDGFFRETEDMAVYRRKEGCLVVEMESAALMACAKKRGVQFGQLLYTADTLADPSRYDPRDWGERSVEYALQLLFEAARRL